MLTPEVSKQYGPTNLWEICFEIGVCKHDELPDRINKSFDMISMFEYLEATLGEYWVYDSHAQEFAIVPVSQKETNYEGYIPDLEDAIGVSKVLSSYEDFLLALESRFGSYWFHSIHDDQFIWFNTLELPKVLDLWSDLEYFNRCNRCSSVTKPVIVKHFEACSS